MQWQAAEQTATNQKTGEKMALVGGRWVPYTESATNQKTGQKLYLITPVPQPSPRFDSAGTPVPAPSSRFDATRTPVPQPRNQFNPVNTGVPQPSAPFDPASTPVPVVGQSQIGQAPAEEEVSAPMGQRVISFLRPTVEALGAVGGGLAGTPVGPLGMAGGAGLGYGIAKGGLDVLEQKLGYQPVPTPSQAFTGAAKDVVTGATLEAGGQIVGNLFGRAVKKLQSAGEKKAQKIALQALGPDLNAVKDILKNARPDASVAEITASVKNPTWQALIERSLARDPSFVLRMKEASDAEAKTALTRLAGGVTETDIRASLAAAKEQLNNLTEPQKQAILDRANLGRMVDDFEKQSGRLSNEAAAQVQQVRDMISAGDAANAWARLDLIKRGLPAGATKYTFFGEMSDKAWNTWADKAATASLDLGQGARFAKQQAEALRAQGLAPLRAEPVLQTIANRARNPEFAGNDLIDRSLKNVADDIAKWTDGGGILDARALDAIRKNSVNAAVAALRPGESASAQKKLAAGILTNIKPSIIQAIEDAGGKGYGDYLQQYEEGMIQIARQKLVGKAAKMWETSPDKFVRLVEGESPEVVEKILGPGKYKIASELSERTMSVLQDLAQKRIAQVAAARQASEGQVALAELLKQNVGKFRLPTHLKAWVVTTNKALEAFENAVGQKTMKSLTQGLKTPQGAANLLGVLTPKEKARLEALMRNISVPEANKLTTSQLLRGTATGMLPSEYSPPEEEQQ